MASFASDEFPVCGKCGAHPYGPHYEQCPHYVPETTKLAFLPHEFLGCPDCRAISGKPHNEGCRYGSNTASTSKSLSCVFCGVSDGSVHHDTCPTQGTTVKDKVIQALEHFLDSIGLTEEYMATHSPKQSSKPSSGSSSVPNDLLLATNKPGTYASLYTLMIGYGVQAGKIAKLLYALAGTTDTLDRKPCKWQDVCPVCELDYGHHPGIRGGASGDKTALVMGCDGLLREFNMPKRNSSSDINI